MNPIEIAAEVLALPAGELTAVRIKGGLTNESWRVDGPDNSVVVRISTVDEQTLQLNRANEAIVLKRVQQAGIGAEVLLCAPERRLLVTRALPAETLDMAALRDPYTVQKLASLLRDLHALSVPAAVQTVNLLTVLQNYWVTLDEQTACTDVEARRQARLIAMESTQVGERCLCHHDVHHLNLMSDGQRLWLLDWEYAGLGDPLFDLAAVCCYHDYDEKLRELLLREYRGSITQAEYQRLLRMCWLFDYIKELWLQVRNFQIGGQA